MVGPSAAPHIFKRWALFSTAERPPQMDCICITLPASSTDWWMRERRDVASKGLRRAVHPLTTGSPAMSIGAAVNARYLENSVDNLLANTEQQDHQTLRGDNQEFWRSLSGRLTPSHARDFLYTFLGNLVKLAGSKAIFIDGDIDG